MTKLPPAITENIVIQSLENEVLIYNLLSNKAFCLNQTSAIVYQACDGETTLEQFKNKHQFTDDLIFFALDELSKQNLIENSYESPLKGIKRREVIKKIGLASMVALPIIASLIAPTAAQAAISCGGNLPMGTILGCTVLESQCLSMNQMCVSCSTTGTVTVGAGACEAAAPFLCVCD